MTAAQISEKTNMQKNVQAVAAAIAKGQRPGQRFILAIVGAPGAGKSTFADALSRALNQKDRTAAEVLPMDGYHLDNAILTERGLLAQKGAPDTFDVDGFTSTLVRIARNDGDVLVPVFDRDADVARAGARVIKSTTQIIIVEGNYLLLDRPEWTPSRGQYDLTVFLDVPLPELEKRLIERWIDHGLNRNAAIARAQGNDLVNASVVNSKSLAADICINSHTEPAQC